MIQFDEHIFQMGWFNHQPACVFVGELEVGWLKSCGLLGREPAMNRACGGYRGIKPTPQTMDERSDACLIITQNHGTRSFFLGVPKKE